MYDNEGTLRLSARRLALGELVEQLRDYSNRRHDVIAPSSLIRSEGGVLVVTGTEPIITDDGVTSADGRYAIGDVFTEGLAGKLNIPLAYLRKIKAERPDLFDANVNGWLNAPEGPDPRSFMLRLFEGDTPFARAFLSDRYRIIDNLNVVMAVLGGLNEAGIANSVNVRADLSERKMYLHIDAPEITAYSGGLMRGYRSPFSGMSGDSLPMVSAGLLVTNSEVGGGALSIAPHVTFQVCSNGLTVSKDAVRKVHLGGQLDDGVVQWTDDTQRKNLDLVTAQVRDAVTTFLNTEYMVGLVNDLSESGEKPVTDAVATLKRVGKSVGYTAEQQEGILSMFIQGGQMRSAGVLNAVTAYAQTVESADEAADLNASAIEAMLSVRRSVPLNAPDRGLWGSPRSGVTPPMNRRSK